MPPARTHFCAEAARKDFGFSAPVNTFLNGTMPALVNIKVGSWRGTSGAEGTTAWSFLAKKSRKAERMSLVLELARWVWLTPPPSASSARLAACGLRLVSFAPLVLVEVMAALAGGLRVERNGRL